MIRYALACAKDHRFDSWFQSAQGFETLAKGGMLACPICGSSDVSKALMAPSVRLTAAPAPEPPAPRTAPPPAPASRPLAAGQPSELEAALTALRKEVEANSDYVGADFAKEARAIHDGDVPARPIYGEARADEARKLVEDGVPVMPLPFIPQRRTN